MTLKRIEERFAYAGGKVDRTGPRPVIRDVLLCGPVSANHRRYLKEAFAGDQVRKYNGRPVFLNHSANGAPRQYESRIAKVINARHRADGMPVGDLEVRPKHPYAEAFLDDAEHDPNSVGMSHVANCHTRPGKDGWDDVHALESIESVDVVLDPATTNGLHEQTGSRPVKISLKQFVERFGAKWGAHKWAAATQLVEDLGDMGAAPVMDAPPADTADGDLKTALMAAITPMLDEAFDSGDSDKVCSAIRDFIKLHAKHTGKAEPKAGDGDKKDDPAAEGKKPLKLTDLVAECAALGVTDPSGKHLATLAEIPTAAGRALVIESIKGAGTGHEKPSSAGRGSFAPPPAPTPGTKTATESAPPTGGKAFAEWVK